MVNFYNDYVSCKKEATLSQVAGRRAWMATAVKRGRASGGPHTYRSPQTTWTTSRRWQEWEL